MITLFLSGISYQTHGYQSTDISGAVNVGAAPSGEFGFKWSRFWLRALWWSLAGRQGCCEAAQWNKGFSPVLFCAHPAHPLLVKLLGEAALPCMDAELVFHLKPCIFCLFFPELLYLFNLPQLYLPSKNLRPKFGLFCAFYPVAFLRQDGSRRKARAVGCSPVHLDTPAGRWTGAIPVPDATTEAAGEKNLQNSVNSYKWHGNRILKSRNSTWIPSFAISLTSKCCIFAGLTAPAAELVCNSFPGEGSLFSHPSSLHSPICAVPFSDLTFVWDYFCLKRDDSQNYLWNIYFEIAGDWWVLVNKPTSNNFLQRF